ncbi:hypothetical protein CANCADRAFT_144769 [Tortispora caseinolytica NRRL Y-17796]|uniref:Uncharacterized protein n=1 Tax=Tortispora caseinolytica NRRL Y-17796 TaxID=767744 RepID=A0A1E4T9A9_9ASCO|nr:hypothetical protein CANCADRAFT_144769 [Tortispora caseinolytica NRRL Y-17796]
MRDPDRSKSSTNASTSLSYLLTPASFHDTFALFALILQFPASIITIFHLAYLLVNLSSFSFASTPATTGSSTSVISNSHSNSPDISFSLLLFSDAFVLLVDSAILPHYRVVIADLASALVAASLGGGGIFERLYNSVRAALLLEGGRIVYYIAQILLAYIFPNYFYHPFDPSPSGSSPDIHTSSQSPIYHFLSLIGIPVPYNSISTLNSLVAGKNGWLSQSIAIHIIGYNVAHLIHRIYSTKHDDMPIKHKPSDPAPADYADDHAAFSGSDIDLNPFQAARRRRRIMAVRSQQPLWSTLASALVSAAKESESLNVADYSAQSSSIRHWPRYIKNVLDSALLFFAPSIASENTSRSAEQPDFLSPNMAVCALTAITSSTVTFEVDSMFFYELCFHHESYYLYWGSFSVTVNGITWPQATIEQRVVEEEDIEDGEPKQEVYLRISGLSQSTNYDICILRQYQKSGQDMDESALSDSEDEDEAMEVGSEPWLVLPVCKVSVSTLSADSVSPGPAQVRTISPVTTLLDALTAATNTLSEEKMSLKKKRKEQTRQLNQLRTELDVLKAKVGDATDISTENLPPGGFATSPSAASKSDERTHRRLLALQEVCSKMEEEIKVLDVDLASLNQDLEEDAELKKLLREALEKHDRGLASVKDLESQLAELQSSVELEREAQQDKLKSMEQKLELTKERYDTLSKEIDEVRLRDKEESEEDRRFFEEQKQEYEEVLTRRKAVHHEFSTAIAKMDKRIEEIQTTTNILRGSLESGIPLARPPPEPASLVPTTKE